MDVHRFRPDQIGSIFGAGSDQPAKDTGQLGAMGPQVGWWQTEPASSVPRPCACGGKCGGKCGGNCQSKREGAGGCGCGKGAAQHVVGVPESEHRGTETRSNRPNAGQTLAANGPVQPHDHAPRTTNPWPIDDPRHNLVLLAQELLLLEGHLADPDRRCPSCVTKHALTARGLADEGRRLDARGTWGGIWEQAAKVALLGDLQAVRELRQGAVVGVLRDLGVRRPSGTYQTGAGAMQFVESGGPSPSGTGVHLGEAVQASNFFAVPAGLDLPGLEGPIPMPPYGLDLDWSRISSIITPSGRPPYWQNPCAENSCRPYDQCIATANGKAKCVPKAPDCRGRECGPDGCGNSCGTCPPPKACQRGLCTCPRGTAPTTAGGCACVPKCTDPATGGPKQCGPDGCGGQCGQCKYGTCMNGSCSCTPQCPPNGCGGPDGCGGTCTCPQGSTCVNGQCVPPCVPQCAGKACGPDGCGGQCGQCPATFSCDGQGNCVPPPPPCAGLRREGPLRIRRGGRCLPRLQRAQIVCPGGVRVSGWYAGEPVQRRLRLRERVVLPERGLYGCYVGGFQYRDDSSAVCP